MDNNAELLHNCGDVTGLQSREKRVTIYFFPALKSKNPFSQNLERQLPLLLSDRKQHCSRSHYIRLQDTITLLKKYRNRQSPRERLPA